MTIQLIRDAEREQIKLRCAILGPSGSGKSYTAMRLAQLLAKHYDTRVCAIDTEHRSLRKYVNEAPDGFPWRFGVVEPDSFSVETYIEALDAIEGSGAYGVCIIDSLSHAWAGKDGILEFLDEVARRQYARGGSSNRFSAWREATPKHNELVERMLACEMHLIVTMRVKTEYVQDKDENGKAVIRKLGLQPVQRDGLEYEFDVVGDIDLEHNLLVSKTRCSQLTDKLFRKPGPEMANMLIDWLDGGAPVSAEAEAQRVAAAEELGRRAAKRANGDNDSKAKAPLPLAKYSLERQAEFLTRAAEAYGIEVADVLERLGVDALNEYDGTAAEAKAKLDAYVGVA